MDECSSSLQYMYMYEYLLRAVCIHNGGFWGLQRASGGHPEGRTEKSNSRSTQICDPNRSTLLTLLHRRKKQDRAVNTGAPPEHY